MFLTPDRASVGVSVTVWAVAFQSEPIAAVLSVVAGGAVSGVGVNDVSVPLLPATSRAWTPSAPGGVGVPLHP